MNEFLWPYTENSAPLGLFDAAQLDDAELERRRDSRVYNLLQQEAAVADKRREENKQIAAERADLKNNDKHKGRGKARSPDREKGPRICPSCGEHTWEQMPFGACDACGMRAALKKSFPTRWESREAAKDDDDDADIPAAPKKRKAAQENQKKAPQKGKGCRGKEGNQFFAQFVAGGSHGQPPLVSSWAPQQTKASSSWQAPPPPPPPRAPSSSRQAPPPPPPTWSRST